MKKFEPSIETVAKLEDLFRTKPVTGDQQQRMETVHEKFNQLGRFIIHMTASCPEQIRALEKLRDVKLIVDEAIRKYE